MVVVELAGVPDQVSMIWAEERAGASLARIILLCSLLHEVQRVETGAVVVQVRDVISGGDVDAIVSCEADLVQEECINTEHICVESKSSNEARKACRDHGPGQH